MEFTAREICEFLEGTLEGDPLVKVLKPAKIEEGISGDVCFLANPKYIAYAYSTEASVLIVNAEQQFDQPINATVIRVKDAYTSFARVLEQYKLMNGSKSGTNTIEQSAHINSTAKIGQNVHVGAFTFVSKGASIGADSYIYPNVFIGVNVSIGINTTIYPGVVILDDCVIGNNCIVGSGTIIGSDGFGFAPQGDGTYKKVAQTGNVVIEDLVEIGANATIDRATMGSTLIKKGAKLDNLIQIAHNVEIGENTVIAAQSGISGSTKIGKNCIVGGQVGIVGHLIIADGTKINAQSGVAKNIKEMNQSVTGSPAFDYSASMRSQVIYRQLPEMMEKLANLEAKIKAIAENNNLGNIN